MLLRVQTTKKRYALEWGSADQVKGDSASFDSQLKLEISEESRRDANDLASICDR